MSYTIVRTDNMSGTVEGKNLVSLKYSGNIENGTIVKVGALVSGEREVRSATLAAKGDALKDLALVASVELIKDKDSYALNEFVNKSGEICRGYRLTAHDVFSVTLEGFAASQAPAVGNIVEVDGSGKLIAVESATQGSTTIGNVIAIEDGFYVIEVAA